MALIDIKVNSEAEAGRNDILSGKVERYPFRWTTGAADSIGSIVRIAHGLPSDAVVVGGQIWTDGVTSLNDVNVGVYYNENFKSGVVIDDNCLADALDLSSAVLKASGLDLMKAVTPADYGKTLWELAGLTAATKHVPVDVAITFQAAATEADQVAGYLDIMIP